MVWDNRHLMSQKLRLQPPSEALGYVLVMQNGSQYLQHIWGRLAAMSDSEIVSGLVIVVMLSSYLYVKHRRRAFLQPDRCNIVEWSGKPIEVSKLKPTLEQVRLDYRSARQSARGNLYHRRLLRLAQHAVGHLPYFQEREPEGRLQSHGL